MDYHKLAEQYYGSDWGGQPVPRGRQLEMMVNDLWRSYPEYPSTFGACCNEECDSGRSARGGGLCAPCLVGCIGAVAGSAELAETYHQAVLECRRIKRELVECAEESRYFHWKLVCRRKKGLLEGTNYTAAYGVPVTAAHVRAAPSVKSWLAGDELISIEPGAN